MPVLQFVLSKRENDNDLPALCALLAPLDTKLNGTLKSGHVLIIKPGETSWGKLTGNYPRARLQYKGGM